ncbi:YeeE/YedE thiosulfate transporter family protein [Corynebacterium auriscanis]|uniref:YeeE/YedE thiosulfate transporter family protein n=1 Tax=Corynebacterium auriscanis TaxID=99807 RepID=UPI002245487C|nr:YeeE/YedE thiosulfate transporter family protein [Corynebacterium auriscanis]MCX2163892.1 YeeE/YedE family protein [Corynebacterium auriscanis]
MIITGLALGSALGYVMQRGRFCVTGMIRDIFLNKTWRGFTALLIVIAVHAVGLAALTSAGMITPDYKQFAPAAVVLGGLLFGAGIVLAGGCASGTWYRSAEGLVGSWLALLFYGGSAAAMKGGALNWLNEGLSSWKLPITTIHGSLGVSVWWLVIPFVIGVALLTRHFLVQEAQAPKMATLKPKKTGLAHLLTEKPWHFYPTAAIIGVLGVIAWPLSAATGRNDGLGITSPSSNLTKFVISGADKVDWGVMLVLGLLIGAFIAAKLSGEFRLRVPSPTQAVRSVIGGIFMGVGASAAGGCTVGNGMVQTSLFSYQGWVALLFIAIGIGVAAKLWLKPTEAVPGQSQNKLQGTQPIVQQIDQHDVSPRSAFARKNYAEGSENDADQWQAGSAQLGFQTAGTALLERKDAAQRSVASDKKNQVAGLRQVGEHTYALDTLGAVCPFPLVDAKTVMEDLEVGDSLQIDFDCTQATDAIPRWAAADGHEVTNFEQTSDAGWTITVKKG